MMQPSDLTAKESRNVRAAMQFLRRRLRGWPNTAKALRSTVASLHKYAYGRAVSPTIAFRLARLAKVGVDDILAGRWPAPNTCPHCGHTPDEDVQQEEWRIQ